MLKYLCYRVTPIEIRYYCGKVICEKNSIYFDHTKKLVYILTIFNAENIYLPILIFSRATFFQDSRSVGRALSADI